MAKGTLNKAVTLKPFDYNRLVGNITLPEGTAVIEIESGMGKLWAVESVALLTELTGDAHDSKHRYVTVNAADVTAGE